MSVSICTSCLSRLRIAGSSSTSFAATTPKAASSFHSSASRHNVVKKKSVVVKGANAPKLRQSKSAKINKKQKERPKPPPVGQRKGERRRIVLSNTNAVPVQEHAKLTKDSATETANVGQMLALDGPLLDQLREAKAFKTTQNWNLFRTPSTLFRQETSELGFDFEDVQNEKVTVKRLVAGPKASGKSIYLLQAMSMAYLNEWVVLNVPDCQEYVVSQRDYVPVPKKSETDQQMYSQPQLASELLSRLAHSNTNVLKKMSLVHDHKQVLRDRKVKTLYELAMVGVNEYRIAPRIWDSVWKELTTETSDKNTRPPLLIAIDGINFWMGQTKYRSSDYQFIHAHQFVLIKQLLDQLFNAQENSLPNGGMVLACTTKSNHPSPPPFDLLVDQLRAQGQGLARNDAGFPLWDPYSKDADQHVYNLLNSAQHTRLTELNGLSRPESKGLLEHFALSGMLRESVDETSVAEKWTLSGGGIIGELCKIGSRTRTGMFETGLREGVRARV